MLSKLVYRQIQDITPIFVLEGIVQKLGKCPYMQKNEAIRQGMLVTLFMLRGGGPLIKMGFANYLKLFFKFFFSFFEDMTLNKNLSVKPYLF